jgi:hypothetical protein
MDVKSASQKVLRLGKIQRRPELDALRGLFLVWMTLTHLPTRFSELVNQPFGFVSSAEGFVFLSAMLVATLYIHKAAEDGDGVRNKLWKRALKIYGYHLVMLAMVFTVVAAFAAHTHRAAIYNLVNFYLSHPATAVIGSLLLIYCPPLLDILPMYVTFLLVTPYILSASIRRGWTGIIVASSFIWLLAQFGLRTWMHTLVVHVTGLHIPLQETGAFNLFSWQAIWVLALWLGAKSAQGVNPLSKLPAWVFPLSGAVCLFFLGVRHDWLGPHLTQEALGLALDKWQIGPLRVLNLFAFSCVVYGSRKILTKLVLVEPFLTLGKASLEVFCAHVFFVFVGLALLYGEVTELHGRVAIVLLTVTFAALIGVATREVRRKRKLRNSSPTAGATAGATPAPKQDASQAFGLNTPPAERHAEV